MDTKRQLINILKKLQNASDDFSVQKYIGGTPDAFIKVVGINENGGFIGHIEIPERDWNELMRN
jgi:hypothetical protein